MDMIVTGTMMTSFNENYPDYMETKYQDTHVHDPILN